MKVSKLLYTNGSKDKPQFSIRDETLHLKAYPQLTFDRENGSFDWFDSGNLSIGQGTFQNAGGGTSLLYHTGGN